MYERHYSEAFEESFRETRRRERDILQRLIRELSVAKQRGPLSPEAFEATNNLRRLWTVFISDLSNEENALPPNLKANLISIGIWMHKEADKLDSGRSSNFDGLIEVNQLIADGLN